MARLIRLTCVLCAVQGGAWPRAGRGQRSRTICVAMDMFSLTGQKTTVHTDSRSMQDQIRMAAGACAAITSMILQSYGPPQRIDRRMRKIRRYTDSLIVDELDSFPKGLPGCTDPKSPLVI